MAELNEAYSLITSPNNNQNVNKPYSQNEQEDVININNETIHDLNPSSNDEDKQIDKVEIIKIPKSFSVDEHFAVLINDISQIIMEKMITNSCFSSLSIVSLLMVIYSGSSKNAREEIEKLINSNINIDGTVEAIHIITNILRSHTDTILDMTNYLFVNNEVLNHMFKPFYKLSSQISSISGFEFKNNMKSIITSVNRLVSNNTHGLLENPLSEVDINQKTIISLLGISCINIQLSCEFDEEYTKKRSFTKLDGNIIKIPIMLSNASNIFYYECSCFQMTEIPLVDKDFAFGIFLPKKGYENYIHFNPFDVYDKLVKTSMVIYIPKFIQKTKFKLVPLLQLLGVNKIFDKQTNSLNKITNINNISISDVIHETYISVYETKNAKNNIIKKQYNTFRANSAFQYYVYNVKLGLVLYRGIYNGK
jgi:serine protease inhibitor